MPALLTSTSPTTSQALRLNQSLKMSFQLAVQGSGSVAAQCVIEGSHDGQGWLTVATLDTSGTNYSTDGGTFETYYPQVRARLASVNGTATVYYGV